MQVSKLNVLKVGDKVKCIQMDPRFADYAHLKNIVLTVKELRTESGMPLCKFDEDPANQSYWTGYFQKLKKKPDFNPGDKVRYNGTAHAHLVNKILTVKDVTHFGSDDQFLISLEEDKPNSYYIEYVFFKQEKEEAKKQASKPTNSLPYFSEVLLELCNKDFLNETTSLNINIVNSNLKNETNYTKNDLISTLRILDEHNVSADVLFKSTMEDALTIIIEGRDIMEELSDGGATCRPIKVIEDLSNLFDITVHIDELNIVYVIGFNGVVFESKVFSLPAVQDANEA